MLQTLKPIEILSCTIFHFGIAALSSSGYPGAQEACIEFGLAGNPEPYLQSMPCAHSDSDGLLLITVHELLLITVS